MIKGGKIMMAGLKGTDGFTLSLSLSVNIAFTMESESGKSNLFISRVGENGVKKSRF